MKPTAAFTSYLLRIVVPAIIVAGVGLDMLMRQYRVDEENLETMRQARALNVADDLRDAMREARDLVRQKEVLLSMLEGTTNSVRPSGAFAWEPKASLVWHKGGPGGLWRMLAERTRWNEWAGQRKKPPQRALETFNVDGSTAYVVWGRVDGRLFGLAYGESPVPVDSWTWLWIAGICLVVLLVGFLLFEAVQLWRMAEKARRDDALKTRFVSDVSHELRTPLAALGVWADMLAGGRLVDAARRQHALDVIVQEKGRMLRMVDTLLDYTRLEQKRRRYVPVEVDVGEVAREAAELLRGDFADGGVTVLAGENVRATADRDAVKEIFLNLLGNAAKYAGEGPVEVDVSRDGGRVRAVVADRGPGIPDEVRARMFERFYRAEGRGAAAKGGFGLGLPISRRLARDMGGDLTAEARDGGGSVFILELPAVL
ncbi:MAG: HAMP domain-containing histidine kinase [Kiritimatiellae bacterium]|nr:HAMP domain-containing histidine kinase [Kiritimatiellia bacterium]